MAKNKKDFLVSVADFALFYNGILACTGTTNLNTSIDVTMQDKNINAGKGNGLLYSYKYGRELEITLEAADWKLEYIAANVGTKISEGLTDVYKFGECVNLTNGIGVLSSVPVGDGDVAIELSNGAIVTVKSENTTIDLTKFGLMDESVKATYQYNQIAKSIVIDSDSSPNVFKLVLTADKHNNNIGKTGSVQIEVPSFQPSGNFTMSFTPDGASSTSIKGKALSVSGDRCSDGSAVYAYVKEFDDTETAMIVSDIAISDGDITMKTGDTATLSVIGLKGELYSPIKLENENVTFVSGTPTIATVDKDGIVTVVAAGEAKITATYNDLSDEITVTVVATE